MSYRDLEQIRDRIDAGEFLQFDERDPCYTWLFPLRLGPFDPGVVWKPCSIPAPAERLTLYVHVPFCRFVCSMCPFTHERLPSGGLSDYCEALIEEIRFYSKHPNSSERPVTSVYFGGGTASTLTPTQVDLILGEISDRFSLAEDCEITIECHPCTVDREYLTGVYHAGVNRISFGIQSFQQRFIDALGLHQRADQSVSILEEAMAVGFRTVAIDLMYNFPGESLASVKTDLDKALSIGVQGISTYALDPHLRNLRSVADGQGGVHAEEEMYYYICDRLSDEGFLQVAQPDFARPGHENRQILDLWGAPQAENLGFGAGAFSEAFNGATWCNIHDSPGYISSVKRGEVPVLMGQTHSMDEALARYPALGVRCLSVPLRPYRDIFDVELTDLFRFELENLCSRELVKSVDTELRVTRKGRFFIDNISKAFFNLSNRGKSQIWGIHLAGLRPKRPRGRHEIHQLLEVGQCT